MWNHWVVRASTPLEPFKEDESAQYAWAQLLKSFPEMIFATLMPNHLHLILADGKGVTHQRRKLVGFVGTISKWNKVPHLWQSILPPRIVLDQFHLRRQVRYLALNPCRKQLCADPLEWQWSTYRDVMGATVDGGYFANRVAAALAEPKKNFEVRFHAYVSGDPSVCVQGTPPPTAIVPKQWAEKSIGEILAASASALRESPARVRESGLLRNLFIHCAYRHGWRKPSLLSKICCISVRTVQKIMSHPPGVRFEAVDLCLGDVRLRSPQPFDGLVLRREPLSSQKANK